MLMRVASWLLVTASVAGCSKHEATKQDEPARAAAMTADIVGSAPAAEAWWTPPDGERVSVEALAYGFAGLDEDDLGAIFTADLKPIYEAPRLFEKHAPRRVARDGMQHYVVKLRETSQFDAGFQYMFVKVGGKYRRDRDFQIVRAMQVREVIRLDESARMRKPPDAAVFYLAEVHTGAAFDLWVEGEHAAMGKQLELLFLKGEGSAKHVRESSSYRLHVFGLGLRDVSGTGIFAMSADEIAQRYQTGTPVPVQLVFRTIPGRTFKREKLPIPEVVLDEPAISIPDGKYQSVAFEAGSYRIEAFSRPNGLTMSWLGSAPCDQQLHTERQYKHVQMTCETMDTAELRLINPTVLGWGATEHMSLYVTRLR